MNIPHICGPDRLFCQPRWPSFGRGQIETFADDALGRRPGLVHRRAGLRLQRGHPPSALGLRRADQSVLRRHGQRTPHHRRSLRRCPRTRPRPGRRRGAGRPGALRRKSSPELEYRFAADREKLCARQRQALSHGREPGRGTARIVCTQDVQPAPATELHEGGNEPAAITSTATRDSRPTTMMTKTTPPKRKTTTKTTTTTIRGRAIAIVGTTADGMAGAGIGAERTVTRVWGGAGRMAGATGSTAGLAAAKNVWVAARGGPHVGHGFHRHSFGGGHHGGHRH